VSEALTAQAIRSCEDHTLPMSVTLPDLHALLVLGASFQEARWARAAFLGLVPFALAVASYAVTPGSVDPRFLAHAAHGSGSLFYAVNAGLLLLGVALPATAALGGLRERHRSLSALGLLVVCGIVLWNCGALVRESSLTRSLLAAAAIGLAARLSGAGVQRIGRSGRTADRSFGWPGLPGNPRVAVAFALGALGVILGPHAGLVFVGLAVAAASAFVAGRERGDHRPYWLAVVTLTLGPIWWLMGTIAGPVGLSVTTLGDVPFSPRAEILLALPLALVVWSCFGLWPAHRLFPGGLFAWLGAVLWHRVALAAVPAGLEHWQPVLMPLGVLGLCGAAWTGRSAVALNAVGFLALASGAPAWAVVALLLGAAALSPAPAGPAELEKPVWRPITRLAWAVMALALPAALEAGFRAQVTYTLAAAAGVALALWRGLPGAPEASGMASPSARPAA
jgi:hypothetical protein